MATTTKKTVNGTSKADRIDMKLVSKVTDYIYNGSKGDDLYVLTGDGKSNYNYTINDTEGLNTLVFNIDSKINDFKITEVIFDSANPANNALITTKGKVIVGNSNLKYMVSENGQLSATVTLEQIKNVLQNQANYIKTNGNLTAIDGTKITVPEIKLVTPPKLDVALVDPKLTDITTLKEAMTAGLLVKNSVPVINFIDEKNPSTPLAEDKGQFKAIENTIKMLQLMSITDPDGDTFKIKWHTEGGKMAVRGTVEGAVYDFEMYGASPYMYQIPFLADPIKAGVKPSLTITVTDNHGGTITKTYSVDVAKLITTNITSIGKDIKNVKSFDTGSGANLITAEVLKSGAVNVKNFGDDDRIEITGVLKEEVNNLIKIDGQNATLEIKSPSGKSTNLIKISGITGDLTKVTTIDAFNALANTGDILFKAYEKTTESIGTDATKLKSFNAGSGTYLLTEDATKASGISISNFGATDAIKITGATKANYEKSVSVSGQDITISYTHVNTDKSEVKNVIKIIGVSGDLSAVNNIDSFNALLTVGNITFA